MRVYEVLCVINPNLEASEIEGLVNQLGDVIANQGAVVTKIDRMRRKLAYPIQKLNEGEYVIFTVEAKGTEIAEIERRMRVTDAIVRYLTVRIDEDLKRAEKFRARRSSRAAAGRPSGKSSGVPVVATGSKSQAEEEGA